MTLLERKNTGPRKPLSFLASVGLHGAVLSWMVLGGLLYGGAAWLQHAAIRVLMALEGSLPLRAVEFLEDAESRALLRRSGGGYVFVHDLFRDHLASTASGSGTARPPHKVDGTTIDVLHAENSADPEG